MFNLDITIPTQNPQPVVASPPRELFRYLDNDDALFIIDNSSLELFTTCPRSAFYKLVMKRERVARNGALTFGGALHEGLEALLLGLPIEEQSRRIVEFFQRNPVPTSEDYRTMEHALEILVHYRQRCTLPDYAWELLSDDKGLIVERAFELPLGVVEFNAEFNGKFIRNVHIAWSGRIDAVAHCNGAVRIVDHKTTSIGGEQFVQDFAISNQVLGYVWAAQQLWPSHGVTGFCLNAIHFKKPTGTGPIHLPGPRGGPPALNFFRAYFDYSQVRIAEWANNCLNIVSDFLHCVARNYYPMHTKWCFGKYGACQFHDACTIDDVAVRGRILQTDAFQDVTWNPVAGR